MSYAAGKRAFGFCDRCGLRYDLKKLKYQFIDQTNSNLRVCPECLDIDHEQLQVGKQSYDDPRPLYDPRPDTSQDESRRLFGFNPIGEVGLDMRIELGVVSVTVS